MAFSPAEWRMRQQLAACCRVFDLLGWTEPVHNHVSVRLPGPYAHFLINPADVPCGEVKASNVVKADFEGNVAGRLEWRASAAAVAMHAAIYKTLGRAQCVMNLSTITSMAVASSAQGLSMTNIYAAQIADRAACIEVEGLLLQPDEAARLAQAVANTPAIVLRHHGLMAWGQTLPRVFHTLWLLQRACDVQVASASLGPALPLSAAQQKRYATDAARLAPVEPGTDDMFEALVRQADRLDSTWKQ